MNQDKLKKERSLIEKARHAKKFLTKKKVTDTDSRLMRVIFIKCIEELIYYRWGLTLGYDYAIKEGDSVALNCYSISIHDAFISSGTFEVTLNVRTKPKKKRFDGKFTTGEKKGQGRVVLSSNEDISVKLISGDDLPLAHNIVVLQQYRKITCD